MSNLLVQNIKHTNGTTSQTIDSSGRITTSTNRPHFFALGFSATSDNASAGPTLNGSTIDGNWKLMRNFSTVTENYGNHYDNSTGIFTVPISGLYMINLWFGYTETQGDYIGIAVVTGDSNDSNQGLTTLWNFAEKTDITGGIHFCKHLIAGKSLAGLMRTQSDTVTHPSDDEQRYFYFNVTFLG